LADPLPCHERPGGADTVAAASRARQALT
jgi:hypothetical protein